MNIPEISSYYPPFANQTKPQFNNPIAPSPIQPSFLQKREVEYVNGREELENMPMAPNSSALFLDRNLNVLWVTATDQNGSKTVIKGYCIGEEYEPPKPVTMEDLMAQMQSMNDRLTKMEEGNRNAQSNSKPVSQSKPNGANAATSQRNGAVNAIGNSNGNTQSGQSAV